MLLPGARHHFYAILLLLHRLASMLLLPHLVSLILVQCVRNLTSLRIRIISVQEVLPLDWWQEELSKKANVIIEEQLTLIAFTFTRALGASCSMLTTYEREMTGMWLYSTKKCTCRSKSSASSSVDTSKACKCHLPCCRSLLTGSQLAASYSRGML
jgi:hypothetical protein